MGIKRLDWYIIKKFLGSFIVALGLLTVIVIIFDVSEKIDDFVQKEAPLKAIVVDYYLNFIPYFMNMYSPMVVFLTVILFTSKMAQNSEIVAILSCGVSFHRMMVPGGHRRPPVPGTRPLGDSTGERDTRGLRTEV